MVGISFSIFLVLFFLLRAISKLVCWCGDYQPSVMSSATSSLSETSFSSSSAQASATSPRKDWKSTVLIAAGAALAAEGSGAAGATGTDGVGSSCAKSSSTLKLTFFLVGGGQGGACLTGICSLVTGITLVLILRSVGRPFAQAPITFLGEEVVRGILVLVVGVVSSSESLSSTSAAKRERVLRGRRGGLLPGAGVAVVNISLAATRRNAGENLAVGEARDLLLLLLLLLLSCFFSCCCSGATRRLFFSLRRGQWLRICPFWWQYRHSVARSLGHAVFPYRSFTM